MDDEEVPCVRVRPRDGEATRQALRERGLVDDGHQITVEDGWLYVPVTDSDTLGEYTVVDHAVPRREGQTLPGDLLGFAPSYERLGDVAIVDEDDPERARHIADALVESDLPVTSVVDRASPVQGDLRVREWTVLHGSTETVHREYGFEYALDLATVYFSPRLATERRRVTEQVAADERVFDMFAGVGPFVIPAAARGAETVGCDLNERAVEYLRENARRNGVSERVTAIHGDVRDVVAGRTGPGGYEGWATRVVMNLPHSASTFLDSAVALAGEECTIHLYDIQHEDDPFGPGERAIRTAAGEAYDVSVETRHVVRSYAPHELNVCLDVRLTRR